MLFIFLTCLTMEVCWQLIFSVFVFLKKSAFHLHFWKIYSLTIEFCDIGLFFVFKTLKVSRHCFLACRVLDGKCTEILIFVPLHETHFFSPLATLRPFLYLIFSSLNMICLGMFFVVVTFLYLFGVL